MKGSAARKYDYRDKIRRKKPLTPRQRLALHLYQSGAAPTKRSAADAVGLNRSTFYLLTSPGVNDPQVNQLTTEVDQLVQNATINTRQLVELLSRKAIGKIAKVAFFGDKEENQLRAAIDLADRGSETSKIQQHQIESITLTGHDARILAESMVEAAEVKQRYAHLAQDNFITLDGGISSGYERNEREEALRGGPGDGEGASQEATAEEGQGSLRLVTDGD